LIIVLAQKPLNSTMNSTHPPVLVVSEPHINGWLPLSLVPLS
jgi:hypothetical protein